MSEPGTSLSTDADILAEAERWTHHQNLLLLFMGLLAVLIAAASSIVRTSTHSNVSPHPSHSNVSVPSRCSFTSAPESQHLMHVTCIASPPRFSPITPQPPTLT